VAYRSEHDYDREIVRLVDRATTISVRVHAPFNLRVTRVEANEGLESGAARERAIEVDGEREDSARKHFHINWSDALVHEMVLNTARMSYAQTAETVTGLVRARFPKVEFPLTAAASSYNSA
jgi:cytidylate kinase